MIQNDGESLSLYNYDRIDFSRWPVHFFLFFFSLSNFAEIVLTVQKYLKPVIF